MKVPETFDVMYTTDDNCKIPKNYVTICAEDLEEDMSDNDLLSLMQDVIEENFRLHVFPVSYFEDDFLEWAHTVLKERERNE